MFGIRLKQFQQSLELSYIQWHDGESYDLKALASLSGAERTQAEDLLIARHAADWRDVEALDCLGSERALAEMEKALESPSIAARIEAAERLTQRNLLSPARIEEVILRALDTTTVTNGMVRTLRFAGHHGTPAVKQKLLDCARDGNDDIRVHAAALVLYLYGVASSPFDPAFKSIYLRCGVQNREVRDPAFRDLCAAIGVEP